jgi:hypothetical protein
MGFGYAFVGWVERGKPAIRTGTFIARNPSGGLRR